MIAVSTLGQQEYTGSNLQAFRVDIYPQFFVVKANQEITGIQSQIKIQTSNRNITQLDNQQNISGQPLNTITCSNLMGILPILNKHYLLLVQLCKNTCKVQKKNIYQVQKVIFLPFEPEEPPKEFEGTQSQGTSEGQHEKIQEIKFYIKTYLLTQGYYFSFKYDLSLSRSSHAAGCLPKKKYYWNYNIAKNFGKLEDSRWFVGVIQGSVRSFKMTIDGTVIKYILITRRSWVKGGTRFNARGVDLKGNVANFCETQQLLFVKSQVFSHVQIRGSVPVFWKQQGLYQAVTLDPDQQRNREAYTRHIGKLIANYEKVFCVNLLCLDRKGEDELTFYFQKLVKQNPYKQMRYQFFDVHCVSKGQKFQRCNYLITQRLQGVLRYFGFYQQQLPQQTVTSVQNGVIRVNCLDSLDRTNLIQSKIAYHMLTGMLEKVGVDVKKAAGSRSVLVAADNSDNSSIFVIHLKNAWADNGDMLSKHYTGTGSTHTNVTRKGKRDIKGMFDHGFKSCMRLYQQFVDDNQKQQAIDILLCEHTETVNLQQIHDRLKQLQNGKAGQGQLLDLDTW